VRVRISVILLILQTMLSSIQKNVALGQTKYKENSRRELCDCGKGKENLLWIVSIKKKNWRGWETANYL